LEARCRLLENSIIARSALSMQSRIAFNYAKCATLNSRGPLVPVYDDEISKN